jgi:predicted NBD/HSP70 family sugar kinase
LRGEAYYLGLGLADLVIIFCSDAIVLGASTTKSASLFLDQVKKSFDDAAL